MEVEKSLEYLEKNNISFLKNVQPCPHISISAGEVNISDLDLLIDRLESFFYRYKSFIIKTNGLGLFIKEDINLHIRWIKNESLLDIKSLIEKTLKNVWIENLEYNNSNWIAKSSLAYRDINLKNLSDIDFTKINFLGKEMNVTEISIIEYELNKKKC